MIGDVRGERQKQGNQKCAAQRMYHLPPQPLVCRSGLMPEGLSLRPLRRKALALRNAFIACLRPYVRRIVDPPRRKRQIILEPKRTLKEPRYRSAEYRRCEPLKMRNIANNPASARDGNQWAAATPRRTVSSVPATRASAAGISMYPNAHRSPEIPQPSQP